MSDDRATASGNRRSEIDEQLLLKEWDFTRFFQGFNEKLDKMKQEHQQEAAGQASKSTGSNEDRSSSSSERTLKRQEQLARRKHEQHHQKQHQHQLKPVHRRQESDSKVGNASNAFTRAFRRENSDFFPSARHSAYLKSSDSSQRSSIFASGNRRGSEMSVAGIIGKKGSGGGGLNSGEPILTDFSLNREGPQRPRREKTESEIVFGNRHEARRFDFGRDKDENARRRSCRPSDTTASAVVDDAGTIKSTASTTASEYSPIVTQVSPLSESCAPPRISRNNFVSPSCLCACLKNPFYHPLEIFLPVIFPRPSPKCIFKVSIESYLIYHIILRQLYNFYTVKNISKIIFN